WCVLPWRSGYTMDHIPPAELLRDKHLALFIDDLQDHISGLQEPSSILKTLVETLTQEASHVVIVATCRTENKKQVQKNLDWLFEQLSNIVLPSFRTDTEDPEVRQIIDEFERHGSIRLNDWDGTLGSLLLGL